MTEDRSHIAGGSIASKLSSAELLRLPAIERERSPRRKLLTGEKITRYLLWTLSLACIVFYLAMSTWVSPVLSAPMLVGLSIEEAQRKLADVGLQGNVAGLEASDAPQGEVIDQLPLQGTRLQEGDRIELHVSAGPDGIVLPDLIGQDIETARMTLERLGLVVSVKQLPSDEPAGTVLLTTPPSGFSITDTENEDELQVSVYVASHVLSAGLVEFALNGLQVVIEPHYVSTAAGDVSFDVSRRLSSLFEAAHAEVTVTRSSRERSVAQGEFDRRAEAAMPELQIRLSVNTSGGGGIVIKAPDISANSAAVKIQERLQYQQIEAGLERIDAFGEAAARNTVEIVLGSTASPTDLGHFEENYWRDAVARAVYMAVSPQFDLNR
ncbi:MAG: PASTA domain-containing protein [Coriobacteriia bacterium]|nr:PASTA domain-containing protein [Coriobacteriia bacterium]MCL2537153.1 PASTA domain-containing protein [Coriobacteriia bacterium]